jgi:DNA mismatch repair protein MutS
MSKASSPLDTPMMRQYLEAKNDHPDAVILMRMGDFYEAFLDCAEELSRICGVALTSRNKDSPEPVMMAGVPHHSLQTHLPKLLAAGKRVAVVDQLEDPAQAKGLVKRGLTRVITPGTLIDESALESGAPNVLVAVTALAGLVGVAALDVSTGRFTVEDAGDEAQLALILARLAPAELLLPASVRDAEDTAARLACLLPAAPPIAALAAYAWQPADARRHLCESLRVGSLDGFGILPTDDHLVSAAAAALRYAAGALRTGHEGGAAGLGHIRTLSRLQRGGHLTLDATCRRNLELVRNARDGSRRGTLLEAIDRTRTAPGARLLAEWLARPLADPALIALRHDAVGWLVADDGRRATIREHLARVYDGERLLARVATGRANARDLVHLASSLTAAAGVAHAIGDGAPQLLDGAAIALHPAPGLAEDIARTLVEDPPLAIGEGGLVRDGIDAELDELRVLNRDASAWLADYQAREASACGLPKLKVGYNNVFGYYIELPKSAAERVPPHFVRKQTLVNAERYITPELKEHEDKVLHAEERSRARELALFGALRTRAEAAMAELSACAQALAIIDVIAGLAELARTAVWCRPVVDDSGVLDLRECRHPVVERVIGHGSFVANDCVLDASLQPPASSLQPRLAVITGPNMAGKSTYIRQVALAVILAQAGSFVPAASARLGVCDRVFTRVGAGDELARNLSTFMVEMAETAAILNHATTKSLVVLDEVGRGTSTFDGLSLAWAITEHLHDRTRCRALFATHYHEMTDLAEDRPGIGNLTVAVAEQDDDVVFLHRIVPGAAAKSYGIHVARLAGVPATVVARAREVLDSLARLNTELTEAERPAARQSGAVQLTLWAPTDHPAVNRLRELDPDALTPKQAQDLLYQLKRMV